VPFLLRCRLPAQVKFDGYRMQLRKAGRKVWLFTRNGHDWTERFPLLASVLAALPACIIDSELVATDEHGIADFAALQRTVRKRQKDGLDRPQSTVFSTKVASARSLPKLEHSKD
jgi:ATP-dependent DNA ligase